MRFFLCLIAVLATVAVPFGLESVSGPSGWLHGSRLVEYRALVTGLLVVFLWSARRLLRRTLPIRVAVGVVSGYVAGLLASTTIYAVAGYQVIPPGLHGNSRYWAAFVAQMVFMQMLPPMFVVGLIAALIYHMLLSQFRSD
jgi:hypothetical protein